VNLAEKVLNKDLFEVLNENLFYGTDLCGGFFSGERLKKPKKWPFK